VLVLSDCLLVSSDILYKACSQSALHAGVTSFFYVTFDNLESQYHQKFQIFMQQDDLNLERHATPTLIKYRLFFVANFRATFYLKLHVGKC